MELTALLVAIKEESDHKGYNEPYFQIVLQPAWNGFEVKAIGNSPDINATIGHGNMNHVHGTIERFGFSTDAPYGLVRRFEAITKTAQEMA